MTDDRHDDLLRQILASHAETIVPKGDGLMNIQARTAERGARSRWLIPAAALATAAAVAAGFVIGNALLDDGREDTLTPLPLASQTATEEPSEQPSPTVAPTVSSATSVAVYYLHDDGRGLRLYREFHAVQAGADGKVKAAVTEMLSGAPRDPDYSSLWPKGTSLLDLTVSGSSAVVDLSAEARNQTNAGAEGESRSVQQLVYTVTANAPAVKRVELRVEGKKVSDLWGHGFGANPQSRAPQTDVQGFVWLLQPTQGATSGSPVTISGVACTFEATVNIEVVRAGKVVKTLHTMTDGGCPHFGPFSTTVDLEPGDYLIRAFEASAKDGSATYVDDKAITVT